VHPFLQTDPHNLDAEFVRLYIDKEILGDKEQQQKDKKDEFSSTGKDAENGEPAEKLRKACPLLSQAVKIKDIFVFHNISSTGFGENGNFKPCRNYSCCGREK
jgi:hypothetical protein